MNDSKRNSKESKKVYSDNLPRLIKGKARKCCALTNAGQICNRKAVAEVALHLDNEIYDYNEFTWLRAYVCQDHMSYGDRTRIKEKSKK